MSAVVNAIIKRSKDLLNISIDETKLITKKPKEKRSRTSKHSSKRFPKDSLIDTIMLDRDNFAPCMKKKR